MRRNRLASAGVVVVLAILAMAGLASVLAPADPTRQELGVKLSGPSHTHPLGTDAFGRDVLSRLIYGSRTSLLVGACTVLVALALGVPLGLLSGFSGGWVDNLVMRVMDALLSFPAIMLALALMGVLGPSLHNVIVALGIVYTPTVARLTRASTLAVREEEYITAARGIGVPVGRIVGRHVLPNIAAPLVVEATYSLSAAIVAAATLSFLGLGVQPPTPDWGWDLSEGRRYIRQAPWLILAPTGAIGLAVLGVNFLGDGLRDAMDPRYRTKE